MQKFLSDLNEILAAGVGADPTSSSFIFVFAAFVMISILALLLAIFAVSKTSSKKVKKEKPPESVESHTQIVEESYEEPMVKPNVNVGEFGKIVSATTVSVKGVELNYFIIKKSKYDKETLPIGSIVVVLKRSAKEAYVKLADDKELKRFKGH